MREGWVACAVFGGILLQKGANMKEKTSQVEQPEPFTPGMSKAAVRQHAYQLFRDKLANEPLTLEDWVLAEKDLVRTQEAEQS